MDESDPISILVFLKKPRDAHDSIGVYEEAAVSIFPYLMKKPASFSLSVRLSSRKPKQTDLYDERMWSYVEVANVLLATYVTDDVITVL